MAPEPRRITVELPARSFARLEWCKQTVGASTFVEVVRHALIAYETALRGQPPSAETSIV